MINSELKYQFNVWQRLTQELEPVDKIIRDRVERIAQKAAPEWASGWWDLDEFHVVGDAVQFAVSTTSCGGDTESGEFPVEWIYRDDWEQCLADAKKKAKERQQLEQAAREAKQAAEEEQRARETYERLKKRFEENR